MERSHSRHMAGKTVLVTGGSGGIGKATAVGLATLGAHLAITGRDRARAEDAAREDAARGRRMLGDGARPEAVDDITWETSEVIDAFVGQYLGVPGEHVDEAVAHWPSIKQDQHIASVLPS